MPVTFSEFAQGVRDETAFAVLAIAKKLKAAGKNVVELEIGPEVLEHLDQVRLAGAEEPADPNARLLALVQVAQIGAEDANQAIGILAVADEVDEFVAQGVEFGGRLAARHLRDALVEQRVGTWVFLVNLKVLHGRTSTSLAVIGTA